MFGNILSCSYICDSLIRYCAVFRRIEWIFLRFPVTHSKQPALLKAELFVYAEGGCVGGFCEECEAVRFCAVGIDEMRNGSCG